MIHRIEDVEVIFQRSYGAPANSLPSGDAEWPSAIPYLELLNPIVNELSGKPHRWMAVNMKLAGRP